MTTLTIIFISITVYLIIAFIWCFIASTITVLDAEDLVYCLFWIIVPYVLIKSFILRLKNNKK